MKKIYILLAVLLGLSLITCKKDAVPDKLTVTAEVKEVTTSSVIIEGSYEYSMEITEFEMYYSTTEDMNGAQSVKVTPEGNDFSVELTKLEDNTQYYFNFVFTSEYNSTTTEDVLDFKTLEILKPTLTTNNISNILEYTAECGGNVTDDGGGTVTERGICWSTSHYPSVMDNKTKNGSGTGSFTAKMTNLLPNTKYYVRAYATNEKGTNYGAEKGFTTKDVEEDIATNLPTVTTKTVSEITETTATSGGNVTDDGGGTVTARGMCWSSKYAYPTISDSKYNVNGSGTGSFTSKLTNLEPNTFYYVRAYATNSKGTAYGSVKSFTTLGDGTISAIKPSVTTRNVTAITANSATCGGTVTDDGGATVTARGVCYSVTSNPTINDMYTEDGTGAGSFISQLTNLYPQRTYYVRAYAINEKGTSYGEEFAFTTLRDGQQEPTGSIDGYDYIDLGLPSGLKWATCNVGANSPEEYGNYYAWGETTTKSEYTDENCLTNNLYIEDISGSFQYDAAMANWGGSWRMPAKAEYEELMSQCSFEYVKYNGIDGLKLIGPNGNYIFFPAAGVRKGNYWNNSGIDYWSSTNNYSAAYVFYYDTYNVNPNIGERYHYLGYPIRPVSGIPAVTTPTVITYQVNSETATTVICNAEVQSDGGSFVTARGFCYSSENVYPSLLDSEFTIDGSGTGSFSSQLTNLAPNTLYYVRAYATNYVGTSYGEEFIFTTLQEDGQQEPTGSINGYDYIDLGLPSGLKWATCNVGANNPEDYGNYYAWGETETKIYYDTTSVTYGLSISELLSQGYIDGNNKLTSQHDAATANWGGSWRMPTKEEYQELIDNCTWTWTTQGGNNGYKVTGPNGNHIFLPAAGYHLGSSLSSAGERGEYWSSTPYESGSNYAWRLYFDSGHQTMYDDYRFYCLSVRPVSE